MTRRLLAVAATALVVLSPAGCAKPNPGVSVTAGFGSAHQQALCWAAEGGVDAQACANAATTIMQGQGIPSVQVVPGNTVGISVDPVVADAGWIPSINGSQLVSTPLHQLYFSFQYPSLQPELVPVPAEGLTLDVRAVTGDQPRGLWAFKLVAAE